MNSIQFKTSELLMFYSSFHGDQVSIVMRYEADAYCLKNSIPNMNSIQPKTKELVTCYCGCHGNLATISDKVCG